MSKWTRIREVARRFDDWQLVVASGNKMRPLTITPEDVDTVIALEAENAQLKEQLATTRQFIASGTRMQIHGTWYVGVPEAAIRELVEAARGRLAGDHSSGLAAALQPFEEKP